MSILRSLCIAALSLWLFVATNPDRASFATYVAHHAKAHPQCSLVSDTRMCVRQRQALSPLSTLLKSLFAAHGINALVAQGGVQHVEVLDCAVFSIARARNGPRKVLFFGALGRWVPAPTTRALLRDESNAVMKSIGRSLRRSDMSRMYAQMRGFSRFRERALPGRPWEWLLALFFIVGLGWLVFPERATKHFTLTWENVRLSGRWWCMVFFHLSHGGSLLRLVRTVVTISYLAPLLLDRAILSLSDLYGVVLTGSALSTALGMLVLARRYVYGSRSSIPRTALEINGGGGCIYALLVAACLSPNGYKRLPGDLMPFELLMINIAFDAVFLAGQKRIADYTAHTGAALGAWLFCSINALR